MRYRWLTAKGAPAGPRHRSVETAAAWLARQARHPRTRPAPAVLVRERAPGRHSALSAAERARLVILTPAPQRAPATAERYLARARSSSRARARRRSSLPLLTARLQQGRIPPPGA